MAKNKQELIEKCFNAYPHLMPSIDEIDEIIVGKIAQVISEKSLIKGYAGEFVTSKFSSSSSEELHALALQCGAKIGDSVKVPGSPYQDLIVESWGFTLKDANRYD